MSEKNMSYEDSMQIINSMIHKAKNAYHDTGIGAMLWGAVITTCSLVRYAEITFKFRIGFDIYLLALVALIPQLFITLRERKERKAKSYNDQFISNVWLAFGISLFLLIHVINVSFRVWIPVANEYTNLAGHESVFKLSEFLAPLFLILYGLPTFVTGVTLKFWPMLLGGLFCWACSIVTVYTSYQTDLLLTAFSAMAAWFIPGLLMKREYNAAKRKQAVAHV